MKILLVHSFYQQYGGEDAAVLADKQLLERHGVQIICHERHNDEIKTFGVPDTLAFPFRTIYCRRTSREIARAMRTEQAEVAYIHNVFPLISPSIYHVLHALNIPSAQVVHDFRFLCPNGWFYTCGHICELCSRGNYLNAVRYRCYRDSYSLSALYGTSIGINRLAGVMRKIHAFIFLNEFYRQKFLEAGVPEDKTFIKPNFIDPAEVVPHYQGGSYALYLGRLSQEKGIFTLIKAFEHLRELRLKIAGTGPLEQALRQYITERNLRNVELLGFVKGMEKTELLKNSLFTVLPSVCYENSPVALLEAYAAGKPVIGSNLGGIPYIIEDGETGFLFEAGASGDLMEKVRHLATNPKEVETMGRSARKLAETRYGPEENYKTLMGILSRICRA